MHWPNLLYIRNLFCAMRSDFLNHTRMLECGEHTLEASCSSAAPVISLRGTVRRCP